MYVNIFIFNLCNTEYLDVEGILYMTYSQIVQRENKHK